MHRSARLYSLQSCNLFEFTTFVPQCSPKINRMKLPSFSHPTDCSPAQVQESSSLFLAQQWGGIGCVCGLLSWLTSECCQNQVLPLRVKVCGFFCKIKPLPLMLSVMLMIIEIFYHVYPKNITFYYNNSYNISLYKEHQFSGRIICCFIFLDMINPF